MSTTTAATKTEQLLQVVPEVPVMNIQDLYVRSKSAEILKNINLVIPKNKITVLLGPSG